MSTIALFARGADEVLSSLNAALCLNETGVTGHGWPLCVKDIAVFFSVNENEN